MLKKLIFRKQYVVNPQLQFMLLTFMFSFAICITIIMLTAHYLSFEATVVETRAFGFDEEGVFFNFLNDQHARLRNVILVASALSTVILFFGGLILSNRIAGPMFRFKSELKKISETGEVKELKFRSNDYFSDVAEAFNDAMKKVNASKGK